MEDVFCIISIEKSHPSELSSHSLPPFSISVITLKEVVMDGSYGEVGFGSGWLFCAESLAFSLLDTDNIIFLQEFLILLFLVLLAFSNTTTLQTGLILGTITMII